MNKEGKLVVKDENGKQKEFFVLAKLEYQEKIFLIYTDYQKDSNHQLKVYSAVYEEKGKEFSFKKIVNPEEEKLVADYIQTLEKDILSGMKFVS